MTFMNCEPDPWEYVTHALKLAGDNLSDWQAREHCCVSVLYAGAMCIHIGNAHELRDAFV